jgi:hypothetical protein
MATKSGGLLVSLGKRLLGFNTSSTGCCAAPAPADGAKQAEAAPPAAKPLTLVADTTGTSCCAPTCCGADAPAAPGRS